MTGSRTRPAIIVAGLLLGLLAVTLQGVQGEGLENVPSEDQCRPYIEKALKDLGTEGSHEHESAEDTEAANDGSDEGPEVDPAADKNDDDEKSGSREKRDVSGEDQEGGDDEKSEGDENNEVEQDQVETIEVTSVEEEVGGNESTADENADEDGEGDADAAAESAEDENKSKEAEGEESAEKSDDNEQTAEADDGDGDGDGDASQENKSGEEDEAAIAEDESVEKKDEDGADDASNEKDDDPSDNVESDEQKTEELEQSQEQEEEAGKDDEQSGEEGAAAADDDDDDGDSKEKAGSVEEADDDQKDDDKTEEKGDDASEEDGDDKKSVEEEVEAENVESLEKAAPDASEEAKDGDVDGKSDEDQKEGDAESKENEVAKSGEAEGEDEQEGEDKGEDKEGDESEEGEESRPEEEELTMEIEIPEILRPREHINQLLKLDEENEQKEKAVEQVADIVLRDLKRLYDNAIKPLETLYKYRDLSNRHFGDPEIFSKPLVLFMGPWSGGKSSIINYLLDIEYKSTSLRTGAEPSPAYFNILMHGEEEEVLDGTQLAADWTFSGLQKFGQGLLDRLKGVKLNNKLLEKVNIVEIPGILEIRKQVQRLFPFNDACQWFIDRADIIFLVYDPSKLDVGPETEAILDQLKGREYQTRIILNKADQVKPEELMRVQGALIWNISPLMSSAEPPIMYSTSLWSIPYEAGAPTRLLYAQERAFLRDLRSAVDKRVEHKIASARRFAVRVRNHAKMVDCYLTTYYNHKSFFAKKKDISDRIIENPQDYHIYEGLSTLTNISRYDLPDPDVYRDFFRLNPLYDFPLLSTTCTYFRGCPINRLDVAIAYDLPELVGKYKKSVETVLHQQEAAEAAATPASQPEETDDRQKRAARSGAARISMS